MVKDERGLGTVEVNWCEKDLRGAYFDEDIILKHDEAM